MAAALFDYARSFVWTTPYYIALASDGSATAPLALMASPEVDAGTRKCFPDDFQDYPNYVAARVALQLPFQRPYSMASKVRIPFLVVLPEWDMQASLPAAQEVAANLPLGQSLRVKGGHFDLYEGGPGFEENLKAQLSFLHGIFGAQV